MILNIILNKKMVVKDPQSNVDKSVSLWKCFASILLLLLSINSRIPPKDVQALITFNFPLNKAGNEAQFWPGHRSVCPTCEVRKYDLNIDELRLKRDNMFMQKGAYSTKTWFDCVVVTLSCLFWDTQLCKDA